MGTVNILFDSTVLIDCLNGLPDAVATIKQNSGAWISVISWIEVMAGAQSTPGSDKIKLFLMDFLCLPLDDQIAEQASLLRHQKKLKLPDAIIFATAQVHHAVLITSNTRDFSEKMPGVRVPYKM
jgi:predicted nucleic acid-binding protein